MSGFRYRLEMPRICRMHAALTSAMKLNVRVSNYSIAASRGKISRLRQNLGGDARSIGISCHFMQSVACPHFWQLIILCRMSSSTALGSRCLGRSILNTINIPRRILTRLSKASGSSWRKFSAKLWSSPFIELNLAATSGMALGNVYVLSLSDHETGKIEPSITISARV